MYPPPYDMSNPNVQPIIQCPECGMYHPPLKRDEMCPLKKDKDAMGNEVDFGDFFIFLKSAITTHIKKNDIKDSKKMLSTIKMQLFKMVEEYSETKQYDNGQGKKN